MGRPRLADPLPEPAVDWLFLDLNAYFASVEQQARPELRDRPVAVVPLVTPNTVCIAASYEAKPFGVKTGVLVREARRLCPQLELVEARPKLYVEYHHALLAAVERCLPVTSVESIDEMACRLMGRERWLPNAVALAQAAKRAVQEVGETLRCSIGLAPNRYLAKVASDMQKPDGLTTLLGTDLPRALFRLQLRDLPGIGPRTETRLRRRRVETVEQLCALGRRELGAVWGGIGGERLWYQLRGIELNEGSSERQSLSRQHVLPPEQRTPEAGFGIVQKMLVEAVAELRQLELWAGGVGVGARFLEDGRRGHGGEPAEWGAQRRVETCHDTFTLLAHLRQLWSGCPRRRPIFVGVRLFDLTPEAGHAPSLFAAGAAAYEAANAAMDRLNLKFGPQTVCPGALLTYRDAAPTRISFQHVPRLNRFGPGERA